MSRRSTPERLHAARRAAALARLISDGELPERADAALAAWEAQAAVDGRERDGGYWEAGYRWIQALDARATPPGSGPPSPPV
jgi:hypothetical protein